MAIYPYTFTSDSSLRNDNKKAKTTKRKVKQMACKSKKSSTKKTSGKKKPC